MVGPWRPSLGGNIIHIYIYIYIHILMYLLFIYIPWPPSTQIVGPEELLRAPVSYIV